MLRSLFLELMHRHAVAEPTAEARWQEITGAYSAPERHYHNLHHLAQIAAELLPLQAAFQDWDAVLVALFYHDFVYDPVAGDNEEQSAAAATDRLSGILPDALLRKAAGIILATKAHAATTDPDTNLFTDADLSILGQEESVYQRYAAAVRREYAVFPDALYRPGRAAVLRQLLSLPALYKTAHFAARFEATARTNMTAELHQLESEA